jgi:sugar-specific transcriptional regulator TrmB
MQEDLVSKLAEFGFTINQAKIYLSVVQNGPITVSEISKISQLHRQDIYKIIPTLEKKGLITRTIDKPVFIGAIPIEKALGHLVSIEKEKICKKISRLEINLKELTDETANHQPIDKTRDEDLFIPLITDEQVKNRADLTFESAYLSYDLIVKLELITSITKNLRAQLQQITKKVKTRMIVENSRKNEVMKALKPIIPKNRNFEVKIANSNESLSYYVIDQNELWINLQKKTESDLPCVLWTNDRNMVMFFQESFNKSWNSSEATTIYPPKTIKNMLVTSKPLD